MNANNENEIMIISTNKTGSYSDSQLVTNNNNNDKHNKSNYNKTYKHRSRKN